MGITSSIRNWVASLIDARNACERGNHDYGEWNTKDPEFNSTIMWGGYRCAWRECRGCGHRELRIKHQDRNFPHTEVDTDTPLSGGTDKDNHIYDFENCDVMTYGPYPKIRNHAKGSGEHVVYQVATGGRTARIAEKSPERALQKYVQKHLDIVEEHGEFDDFEWDAQRVNVRELGVEFTFNPVRLKDGWKRKPDEERYSEYPRGEKLGDDPEELTPGT